MKSKFTLLTTFLLLLNVANAQMRYLKGVLQATQEVPASNSIASGIIIVKYNTTTNFLELFGNYRNLTATINNSHIHGPAAPGVNAGVLVNLSNTGGTIGVLSGTATLTELQEADLLAGNMYTNVHSVAYPSGEIRAQLTETADGQTEFFSSRLQGAQTTPPNGTLATGATVAIIDKTTNTIFLTGSYSGLTTPATNAHIHSGAPGVSGGVIVPVKFTTTTAGTVDTSMVLTNAVRDEILSGNTYVNVHTSTLTAGEIRGQLTQLGQMWFFANALQGSQEVPANASLARGTVIVKYNSVTKVLDLVGDYQNLNAAITGSHIHGPAAAGVNAGVLFNLTNSGGTMGTLTGTFTLSPTQESDLLAGNMYVNIHNDPTYSAGEIRGQLLLTAMGNTQYITGNLQPGQASPSVVSSATGSTTVLLDKLTNKVYLTANYTGLAGTITNAHIHGGSAGVNGGVVVQLQYVTGTNTGTVTGTATVRPTFADSMVNGYTYLNVHSTSYTGGEIRAQLGDLVLPVKLKLFNGFKERNRIVLVWEVEEETNLSHYEIEQQDNNTLQWISKASIQPFSNNVISKNYRQNDMPFAVGGNYVYYRLKTIDKDGKFAYSRIVRINNLQPAAELMLISNPLLNGELKFMITGLSINKKAEISVVDFNGRVMARQIVSAMANNSVNVKSLSTGMYKLVVRMDDVLLQQTFMK